MSNRKKIINVPLVHQTSDLERTSTLDHNTRKASNWIAYVHNYGNLKKINFNALLEDFKEFEIKKKQIEDKFEELYGKRIDIKKVKGVLLIKVGSPFALHF